MKIALLFCLIAALTGCSSSRPTTVTTSTPAAEISKGAAPKGGDVGTDSPILISDGSSTHLRHKGSSGDFQISTNQVIANDSGYGVTNGVCVNGVKACPSAFTSNLVQGWTIDVLDAKGVSIMTVSSPTNATVVTDFHAHPIDPASDASGDTNGTDVTQHDLTFKSAMFTNGGTSTAVPIVCTSSPCKLKIHYVHP